MAYTENLVPLTDLDRTYLRKQAKKVAVILFAMAILTVGLATGFCIYNGDWYIFIFVGIFVSILFFLGVYTYRRIAINDQPDAKKWLIEGEILEKNEKTSISSQDGKQDMNTDYFFVFENREVEVSYINYRRYNAGDLVRVEITEKGNVFLNITPIKIADNKDIPVESDYLSEYSETMSDDERRTIKKVLIKRSIIAAIIILVIYFISFIASAISVAFIFENASQPVRYLIAFGRYYVAGIVAVLLFFLMTRKLLSDYLSNLKKVTICAVSDKIQSNVKLLGRNVKTSIKGDFHYILVGKRLFQVPADDFHRIDAGGKVKIHEGNKSKFRLGVEVSK